MLRPGCAALALLLTSSWAAAQDAPPPSPSPDPRPAGFRFHGYLRSGYGVNGDGDPQEAFKAPNANAKFRLGNETEAYLETTFDYGIAPADDEDAFFDTRITVSYVVPTSNTNDFDTTVALREAWAFARGVLGSQPEAQFWAGERFYDRHDLHLNDFFYRDLSGFGGGVENLRAGGIRLAAAWLGGSIDTLESNGTVIPPGQFSLNTNMFDVRAYDIPLLRGRLSLAFDLSVFKGDVVPLAGAPVTFDDDTGWSLGLLHERPFGSGRNKLSLQYGEGAGSSFRPVLRAPPGRTFAPGEVVDLSPTWQFRLVEDLSLDKLGPIALLLGAVYQELDNGAETQNRLRWVAFGVRPSWALSRHFALQLELGMDHTWQQDGPDGSLVKVTLGPQIMPAPGAFVRPSLRAYVTWARWSDGFVSLVAPVTYGAEDSGLGAGVQLEAWW
jgi:maltoporin